MRPGFAQVTRCSTSPAAPACSPAKPPAGPDPPAGGAGDRHAMRRGGVNRPPSPAQLLTTETRRTTEAARRTTLICLSFVLLRVISVVLRGSVVKLFALRG